MNDLVCLTVVRPMCIPLEGTHAGPKKRLLIIAHDWCVFAGQLPADFARH